MHIRRLPTLFVCVLGLIVVGLSATMIVEATAKWRQAERLATLTAISQTLLKSLLNFRLERGSEFTAMQAGLPAGDEIRDRVLNFRKISEVNYGEGMQRLDALSLPGLPAAITGLRSAHDAMARLRPEIDRATDLNKTERGADLFRNLQVISDIYLNSFTNITDLLDASLAQMDPMVDALLVIKREAWKIRTFGGAD